LPFHALSDGKRYLIDDFSVSYAPSSSIFAVARRTQHEQVETLVLAVPDARAPFIEEEANTLLLPAGDARLLWALKRQREQLRAHGPSSPSFT